MRFQFPKPLHGWRAFLGEVGIIVLGVLIALGADSMFDKWQWRQQASLADEAFQQELGYAALVAYERQVVEKCLDNRIRELAERVSQSTGDWSAAPVDLKSPAYRNVLPVAYRAPFKAAPTDAWENATASGTLNHMPRDRVAELSAAYKQIVLLGELQQQEQRAASQLAPLVYDTHLTHELRNDMLRQLSELDRLNATILVVGDQLINAARGLELGIAGAEVEQARREIVAEQKRVRGNCVSSPRLRL